MSPTSSITPNTTTGTSTNPAASASTDPLASESTFLTLLVAQLQNQDPLNPVDSTSFVTQLTSYSQLEQLINIDKNTTAVAPAASSTTNPTTNPTTPSTSSTNSTTGN
jgi:flagellar basal-body rod modification protein FlgD